MFFHSDLPEIETFINKNAKTILNPSQILLRFFPVLIHSILVCSRIFPSFSRLRMKKKKKKGKKRRTAKREV